MHKSSKLNKLWNKVPSSLKMFVPALALMVVLFNVSILVYCPAFFFGLVSLYLLIFVGSLFLIIPLFITALVIDGPYLFKKYLGYHSNR